VSTKPTAVPRLYIKIPKDYYSRSEAEQDAFFDVLIAQMMGQVKEYNEEQGTE